MFPNIRRLWSNFFSRARTIDNEPLNKVSLIVIILIDIFILINVFTGLDDISRWQISPTQAYPCYSEWETYRTQTTKDKDYETIRLGLIPNPSSQSSFIQNYQQAEVGHLGNVSGICLQYGRYKDKINNSENQKIIKNIDRKQAQIDTFEQANRTIRAQYDSTLLEKIAGQGQDKSINLVGAEKAKQNLDQNNNKISVLKKESSNLVSELVTKSESVNFITFIKDQANNREVEKGYRQATFWYPSIQLAFQSLFLLPLIVITLLVHKFAQRKRYVVISLISWHLLVIFFIPLILKIFEFLQVGAIFKFAFDIISRLFGSLLFLFSYFYILLIPLIGFGIIKFLQKIIFNTKVQTSTRVQKSRCIKCAKKVRYDDTHCPYCGYEQYIECQNCHNPTYKYLPYCKQCGTSQDISHL